MNEPKIFCAPLKVWSIVLFLLIFDLYIIFFLDHSIKEVMNCVIKTLKEYFGLDDALALTALTLGIFPPNGQFFEGFRYELISIGITVLIIANANQYMDTQSEKRKLILQMDSPTNDIAIEAVRILSFRGWLSDGTLKGAYLREANLKGANLELANLEGANLSQANLEEAHLERTMLYKTYLHGANMKEAQLKKAALSKVNLEEALLERAVLYEANLEGANLEGAYMEGADLVLAILERAVLRAVHLEGAQLEEANLEGADLTGAHLEGANLKGVRYSEATSNNTGTIWKNAIYDENTKWPDENFDPKEKGVIFISGAEHLSKYYVVVG